MITDLEYIGVQPVVTEKLGTIWVDPIDNPGRLSWNTRHWVMSKFAARLYSFITFCAGISIGFLLALLVLRSAC